MKRSVLFGVVMTLGVTLAAPAMAQPGGGGRGGFGFGGGMGMGMGGGGGMGMLLMAEPVQKEIDLLEEQISDLREAMDEIRGELPEFDFQSLRDLDEEERREKMDEFRKAMEGMNEKIQEKVSEILLPEQLERIQQIEVQMAGPRAVQIARVQKELDLTDSQKKKIEEAFTSAGEKQRERMQELREGGGQPDFAALRGEMEKMQKDLEKDVMDVLTSSQKSKLDDLKGEPFDVSQLQQRGRGQGGPGGRGQGGPGGGRGQGRPQRPGNGDGGN